MTENKRKRTYSEESRKRMRAAALARYDGNAQQTHERVRAVMKAVQGEMVANDGIYPHNKGAISLAEIARRAGIHPFTFHKPRYVELAKEVREWLAVLKQDAAVGRVRVRKELGTRIQEWKQLYEDLREAHRISETDLAYANARLEEVLRENEELHRRIDYLSQHAVVSLPTKKR